MSLTNVRDKLESSIQEMQHWHKIIVNRRNMFDELHRERGRPLEPMFYAHLFDLYLRVYELNDDVRHLMEVANEAVDQLTDGDKHSKNRLETAASHVSDSVTEVIGASSLDWDSLSESDRSNLRANYEPHVEMVVVSARSIGMYAELMSTLDWSN